ncbi:MAG TPA: amidase, partial [Candidatus Saccharimonadia bacterium]|nr:amidase [Candidatus Saccharimonadia bacterium]
KPIPGIMACLLTALSVSSCSLSALRKPATPSPYAFISYREPAPGDKKLRLAVKDLIDMKGLVTSAGSEYLSKNAPPATKDAECLRNIRRRSDVTIVGKANLSEFAIGVSGSNDYFGTPINPVDRSRVPGGSSSGSAVAVGMNLADVALGTDTAGSIRVPAACCGIAGLKTTFGRISTKGVYPISPKYLDTVGPMARDVDGLVKGMELLEPGFNQEYSRAKAAKPVAKVIRIGRLRVPGTDPAIDAAIDARLAESGFQVIPLDEAFHEEWKKAQRDGNLVAAAASYYHNDEIRKQKGVGNRARKAILFGDLVFSRKYDDEAKREEAIARREVWQKTLRKTFQKVDAIAYPVLQKAPYKRNVLFTAIFEARFMKIQNTVAVNYAGVPAVAIPIPMPDQPFPVTSVQFVGPPDSEAALLNIGRLAESGR